MTNQHTPVRMTIGCCLMLRTRIRWVGFEVTIGSAMMILVRGGSASRWTLKQLAIFTVLVHVAMTLMRLGIVTIHGLDRSEGFLKIGQDARQMANFRSRDVI